MSFSRFNLFSVFTFLGLLIALGACSPAPRRVLGVEDKTADFYWLFSQFNEYYAPLEYKETRHGFKYDALKAKYLEQARTTTTNEEFYKLMYQFVAEFKDAHTSASLSTSNLPARSKVAYLGFSGKRVGDKFLVTELLPTYSENSSFPIKVGDQITKLDGATLKDVVLRDFVVFRNLGNDEANLSFHMNRVFNRVSTYGSLPSSESATVSVLRDKKEVQFTIPWVVKDLYVFSREQTAASKPKCPSGEKESAAPVKDSAQSFQLGFFGINGQIEPSLTIIQKILRDLPGYSFWDGFRFIDTTPVWATKFLGENASEHGTESLAKERQVPGNAIPLSEAKTFPAYVTREKVLNAEGKETGATRFVGYLYLDTFSPQGDQEKVLKEVAATLEQMQSLGVTDLIIDMINNGGGSLNLGMKLAQLFSNKKVVQPELQFRLSETWLDEFEKDSLMGPTDSVRELNRRVFEALKEDKATGKRLSRRFSAESLAPFEFVPNDKLESKLNIVLMVNEMCASMCDIFTGIMKDNNLAKVVGAKTMGAGGNVVEHPYAPNSHMSVRQTESLVVRPDGSYIENNGIDPDVAMNVSESLPLKYEPVRQKALEILLTEKK